MADLIERNALLSEELSSYADDYYGLERLIRSIPSVDAEPVRHAHWKNVPDDGHGEDFVCTACHKSVFDSVPYVFKHSLPKRCPECGAKMDEGKGKRCD